ncbi:MAG TPA: hypothetical protein VMW23_03010 [Sedimentisphaerales bacterium]|nr:hypothetical protein [Sedimentisphaerales bacterium]
MMSAIFISRNVLSRSMCKGKTDPSTRLRLAQGDRDGIADGAPGNDKPCHRDGRGKETPRQSRGLNMFGLRIRPALSQAERVRNDRDGIAFAAGITPPTGGGAKHF